MATETMNAARKDGGRKRLVDALAKKFMSYGINKDSAYAEANKWVY